MQSVDKKVNAQHWFGQKLADGININFCFAILLQFQQKEQNLAGKNSIELWDINLTLVSADGIQIPVLRQALNVGSNLT